MDIIKNKLTIATLSTKEPIDDFAKVRNQELGKVKTEWVLFLDSDEEISSELKEEISKLIMAPAVSSSLPWSASTRRGVGTAGFGRTSDFSNEKSGSSEKYGYKIRRIDRFLGRWLRFGETGNIKMIRLAKKDSGQWERPVHEIWNIKGKIGELKNPIYHYHDSVEEMIERMDRYSSIEMEYRRGIKRKWSNGSKVKWLIESLLFPLGKFIWNYFIKLGFLDGIEGFILAGLMSFHSFLVRAKQYG